MPVVLATDENAVIQPFCALAADLASANPTLYPHELVFETDTRRMKLGDISVSTPYNSLPYFCEQNLFSSIAVSGQTTVTADSITTALTFAAGSNITITTNNTTKTITFAATSGSSATLSDGDYGDVIVSSSGTVILFDPTVVTTAARTYLDDATVADAVNTLGGAASTGSGGLVRKTSAALITPDIGTPTAGTLTSCIGLPVTTGLANIATARILGRVTASTGAVEIMTGTQTTTLLDVFGPDSGSGGLKGLVPATAAGDATKVLKGDGTWAATGTVTSVAIGVNNGITAAGSPITTSGTITLGLGAITPTSVNSIVLSGFSTPTLAVTGTSSISGSNTGDQSIGIAGNNGIGVSGSPLTGSGTITLSLGNITPTTTNGLTIVPTVGGNLSISNGVTLTAPLNATVSGTNTGDQTFTASGDATASGSTSNLALTIANNAVTLAKMAQVASQRILGRVTASTGNVEALTGTQATTILDAFTGDSGSGGLKGLVPAPASGDAAAGKYLHSDGTWKGVAGAAGGTVTSVAISGTNGLSLVSGSPITTAGTIALTIGNIGGTTPVTINGLTITPTTGTISVLSGKTITLNNTLTYSGTDGSAMQFRQGGTVAYLTDNLSAFASTTSSDLRAVISDKTGTGLLVFNDGSTLLSPIISAPAITGGSITRVTDFGLRADTGTSTYDLKINSTEALTATRTLTITTGDANRTLMFAGNATISNVNSGDQLYTASGDATAPSSASNLALTLATVNANVGTFGLLAAGGQPTYSPIFTVNAKGLITAASHAAVIADAATLIGSHLPSNVTGSNLTSVDVLVAGTWHATIIGPQWGGTGSDLSATGGTSKVLMQTSAGANVTVAQLAASDLSNGTTGTGAVVLAGSPTIDQLTATTNVLISDTGTQPTLRFADSGSTTTAFIRAPNGNNSTLSFQAWSGSAWQTLFSIQSQPGLSTTYADLDGTKVTIGGNYIYREFQGINYGKSVLVRDGGTGRMLADVYAPICGGTTSTGPMQSVSASGATAGMVLTFVSTSALPTWQTSGSGTVTSVAVSGANGIGVSGSPITSSGTIALSLGNITPTSVTATGAIQAGTSSNGVIKWWDAANSAAISITAGNNTLTLSGTASISATTFIGNLVGNASTATTWQTARSIYGNSVNGSADVNGPVTVPYGGTGTTAFTPYAPILAGATSQAALVNTTLGASGTVFVSNGTAAAPSWSTFSALMNIWGPTVTGYVGTNGVRQFLTHKNSGGVIVWEWMNVSPNSC